MKRLDGLEAQMLAAPDQQVSLTDPDARSMATSGRGTGMVGYNVQIAVDTSVTHVYYSALRDHYAPGRPIWVIEGADAACGGNPWGGSFIDSFRYLDQLGRLAKQGVQVSIHNTLAAGSYGLLDPEDFSPKATNWAALLWHRLMGTTVLYAGIPLQPSLHVYAHCQPDRAGGVALLVINNDDARTAAITLPGKRLRYTLSAQDASSMGMKVNGQMLQLGARNKLPVIAGIFERSPDARFCTQNHLLSCHS